MRIVTQKEMKEIEKAAAVTHHFTEHLIVEHVGLLAGQTVERRLAALGEGLDVIVLIGKGNNGADGWALARNLVSAERGVRAFVLFPEQELSSENRSQMVMARSFGVKTTFLTDLKGLETYFAQNAGAKIVIDAVFGTGVRLPLSNFMHEVIHFVNANANHVIALDIPSGIDGDSGRAQGNAIKADLTLAVGFPQVGHFIADGALQCGDLEVLEVGFPPILAVEGADKFLLTRENLPYRSDARNKFADKKIFGHTLVVGGSHGLTGAAIMSARASLRSGAGLVTVATWERQYQEMTTRLGPEIMTGYIPNDESKWDKLLQGLDKYDSLVIGPGLGRSARSRRLVLEILNNFPGPLVLDADALNVLSLKEDAQVFALRHAPTVMTPHFGEFARFCGVPFEDVASAPVTLLKEAMERVNCTILLKGPCTFLGLTNGTTWFNFFPNDGMATGGVGDVLAGILGGLLAQDTELRKKNEPLSQRYEQTHQAVLLGVYIHSLAGKLAAQEYGVRAMTAVSLLDSLPAAFAHLDAEGDA